MSQPPPGQPAGYHQGMPQYSQPGGQPQQYMPMMQQQPGQYQPQMAPQQGGMLGMQQAGPGQAPPGQMQSMQQVVHHAGPSQQAPPPGTAPATPHHPHMGPPCPPSPMFVSVPPRTQRLLHSEAYLKYIENLKPERQEVSNWRKQLTATQDNTPGNPNAKLPVHWLGNGASHHDNSTSALWALRDLMIRDTLTLSRSLEYSEL